jgi:hypothetical protein
MREAHFGRKQKTGHSTVFENLWKAAHGLDGWELVKRSPQTSSVRDLILVADGSHDDFIENLSEGCS